MEPFSIDGYDRSQLPNKLVVINNKRLVTEGTVVEVHEDDTVTIIGEGSGREYRVALKDIKEVIEDRLGRNIQP